MRISTNRRILLHDKLWGNYNAAVSIDNITEGWQPFWPPVAAKRTKAFIFLIWGLRTGSSHSGCPTSMGCGWWSCMWQGGEKALFSAGLSSQKWYRARGLWWWYVAAHFESWSSTWMRSGPSGTPFQLRVVSWIPSRSLQSLVWYYEAFILKYKITCFVLIQLVTNSAVW